LAWRPGAQRAQDVRDASEPRPAGDQDPIVALLNAETFSPRVGDAARVEAM